MNEKEQKEEKRLLPNEKMLLKLETAQSSHNSHVVKLKATNFYLEH